MVWIWFIKLARPVNLLIIALTMYAFHKHHYFWATLETPGTFHDAFWHLDFILLVISTVLIAAAGNIINDYFDIRIDRINKPEKIIVGKYVKKRLAMLVHIVFNSIAVLIGFYLAIRYQNPVPLIVHVITTTLLWMYSLYMKRKFLTGNLAVAVMTALIPLLTIWFDKSIYGMHYSMKTWEYLKNVVYVFSYFAFITTLIREVQKDFADRKGDEAYGCKTVPVVLGDKNGKILLSFLFLLTSVSLLYLTFTFLSSNLHIIYVIMTVFCPIAVSWIYTLYAKTRKNWSLASDLMKISMLSAILFFTFVIYVE